MAMNLQWPIANAATDDCVQHCGFKARSQAVSASSFWSLGVCKSRGGKAWEKESHAWRQLDVMEAVPNHCNSQTLHWSASSLPNNELYWRCPSNVNSLKFLDKILQEGPQDSSSGTTPLMSTPTSTWINLSPRPSPSVFAYCKWSKTGGGNGLGTRLVDSLLVTDWFSLRVTMNNVALPARKLRKWLMNHKSTFPSWRLAVYPNPPLQQIHTTDITAVVDTMVVFPHTLSTKLKIFTTIRQHLLVCATNSSESGECKQIVFV